MGSKAPQLAPNRSALEPNRPPDPGYSKPPASPAPPPGKVTFPGWPSVYGVPDRPFPPPTTDTGDGGAGCWLNVLVLAMFLVLGVVAYGLMTRGWQ